MVGHGHPRGEGGGFIKKGKFLKLFEIFLRKFEELCGRFGRIAEAAGEVVLAPHSVTELFSGRWKPRATFEWTILDGSSE